VRIAVNIGTSTCGVLQIGENTDAVRVATYQDIVVELNDWRRDVSSNSLKTGLFNDLMYNKTVPEQRTTEFLVLEMTIETVMSRW
jgi:hypothetical protein